MAEDGDIRLDLRLARGDFTLAVDLRLPLDGTTVVFGPSGCGKSSLLRAVAGLEPCARGCVRIGAEVWQDAAAFLPPHRRRVGMVFQQAALLPHLRVLDNLCYGWKRAGAARARLDDWIERLALAPLLDRLPATLSGGERQRVALARALACEPRWLLLDEPLSALDAERRGEILPYLEAVRREAGVPILHVTHAIEEVSRLADHLVLMDAGRVTASGAALEVLNRADLPLALREDAGVVLPARVRTRDAHGLVLLDTAAGALYAHSAAAVAQGTSLRVRIQARDVSLALSRSEDSSLLNLVPARLEALDALPGGQVQARLCASGTTLLARISHLSAQRLGLRPGQTLWAQVKAVALLL